jgi:hypothetical protein
MQINYELLRVRPKLCFSGLVALITSRTKPKNTHRILNPVPIEPLGVFSTPFTVAAILLSEYW